MSKLSTFEAIHPWWVRRARLIGGIAVTCALLGAAAAVTLIGTFEFGAEAFADGTREKRSSVGLDDHEPDDPTVAPYWRPSGHFEELPEPRPGEWLHRFDEPGQTVDQYFSSGPNAVTRLHHVIYIRPLGEFEGDAPDLGVLAEYVELYYGLPTRILPAIDPSGVVTRRDGGWNGGEQWLTGDLMRILSQTEPDDAYAVLGVTMNDLYPQEDWAFVFGQARFKERVAVHSFARYRPDDELELDPAERRHRYLRRVLGVTTHELGHAFGIRHCTRYRCNMNGANSLEESDDAPLHLCPVDLEKVQTSVGWHPAERYAKLADFYESHGFADQARWARERILSVSD